MNRPPTKRIAYLFSRYPVISQTFCDSEMLELEARGVELTIASLNPPSDTFRHERLRDFRAEVVYPPPPAVLKAGEKLLRERPDWEEKLGQAVERHERDYGAEFKPATRARNAAFFAREFVRRGVEHVHVHFANRATHTALFVKLMAGIPFSFTAHAQDFMVDLGNDDLLRELCREAEFVVAVSDWSRELLAKTCPDSAEKISRIYNGIRLDDFPTARPGSDGPLKLVSVGRLIEFKGFHHLLEACAMLRDREVEFHCTIIGEGPWRDRLVARRDKLGLTKEVDFAGIRTQEQVKALLAESHVFVLPCIVDSKGASDILPTVIMEAMAVSLPVVSTWLVGVPEMVEDQETGLLVESANEREFADALAKLAGNPGLRAQLGEAGFSLAAERFDRAVTTGQLLEKFPNAAKKDPWCASTRLLYLLDCWPIPGDELLTEELAHILAHHPEIGFLACSAPQKIVDLGYDDRRLLEHPNALEFLPDAMVLEAGWRQQSEAVARILRLRQKLGAAVSTERFLCEARRALHIAELLEKRGIRHLHAARSNIAVTAWIVFKLGAAERFSFAAEDAPAGETKVLNAIEKDACLVSRADGDDLLRLAKPAYRRLKLGSLKLRLWPKFQPNRQDVYAAWIKRLLGGG